VNPIDINKHTRYSLELIFSEADKMANQLLKSISENANKSFLLFALYSSLFSYSFIQMVQSNFEYSIILIGSSISILVLRKNLFPNVVKFSGSQPSKILVEYFDNFQDEELEKELLATQIENYNDSLIKNDSTIEKMVNRFFNSIWCMAISFLIFIIVLLISSFIEGSYT
jgi:hypothetical protein